MLIESIEKRFLAIFWGVKPYFDPSTSERGPYNEIR